MSDTTPSLKLPFMVENQGGKELTFNEALEIIDVFANPVVVASLTFPPQSPAEGDCYIVGQLPTGAFTGEQSKIARYRDGVWQFISPYNGMTRYNMETGDTQQYSSLNNVWSIQFKGGSGGGVYGKPILIRDENGDLMAGEGGVTGADVPEMKFGSLVVATAFNIPAASSVDYQVTVAGSVKGYPAYMGYSYAGSLPSGVTFSAITNGNNSVAARFTNATSSQQTVGAGTISVATIVPPI